MSSPLRVNDHLFSEAEAEGSLMNRSAAKQVEFWAELGKRVATSIAPTEMLALMQGIAEVRIEIPKTKPVDPQQVFAAVGKANKTGTPIVPTHNSLYYEASISHAGMIDQVMPDGSRQTGNFSNGKFLPK